MVNLKYQQVCHEEIAAIDRMLAIHRQAQVAHVRAAPQDAHEALHGAADTELTLLLENTGGLAVELSVKYPTEMDLEIEHWADTGEPTAIEHAAAVEMA